MSLEVKQENVDRLVAEKRHKELLGALKTIGSEFKVTPDTSIADGLARHIATMEALVAKIKMPEIPQPIVNVETNNEGILASMSDIAARMEISIASLKDLIQTPDARPREWTFTVTRNFVGEIDNITAKAK